MVSSSWAGTALAPIWLVMPRPLQALALAAVLAAPQLAEAYQPVEVHPWIARQAVAHLVASYPGRYDEALEFVDAIARGAHHEDDPFLDGDDDPTTVRLFRHFYNPLTGDGLAVEPFGSFVNSYLWGGAVNEQNRWGWDDAFAYYAGGDLDEAYFALGHVVHLISDLTVPAHVHLDQHGPPFGDDYENYCTDMTVNQYESLLPIPPAGAPIPEAEDLETLWRETALASYWRNSYPGDLSDPLAPAGALVTMFGDAVSYSEFSENWSIDGVGSLGSGFIEHQPGQYYFKQLDATPAVDRIHFDPAAYDAVELGETGDPMVVGLANDMVPLAILASAAAIKMFLDSDPRIDDPGADDNSGDGEGPDREDDTAGCSATGAPAGGLGMLLVISLCLGVRRRGSRE